MKPQGPDATNSMANIIYYITATLCYIVYVIFLLKEAIKLTFGIYFLLETFDHQFISNTKRQHICFVTNYNQKYDEPQFQ
jgi:hypothetical protein